MYRLDSYKNVLMLWPSNNRLIIFTAICKMLGRVCISVFKTIAFGRAHGPKPHLSSLITTHNPI